MTIKKVTNTTHCEECDKPIQFVWPGGLCSACYRARELPDIELAMFYFLSGHTIECASGLEAGENCICGKSCELQNKKTIV